MSPLTAKRKFKKICHFSISILILIKTFGFSLLLEFSKLFFLLQIWLILMSTGKLLRLLTAQYTAINKMGMILIFLGNTTMIID
jgi:hypothetical protein